MTRTLKRKDRVKPLEQRLLNKEEAAAYMRVSENTFKKRFGHIIPVVVLEDDEYGNPKGDPLYDINDLNQYIDKRKFIPQN